MTDSNNKTSLLVSNQLPAFVREEHETFIKFIEYYYKFLEQDGEQLYVSKNLNNYLDIDIITEHIYEQHFENGIREHLDYHGFIQKMYDNLIKLIPDTVLADRTLILKHAKEFYTSRGTEKSVRFLMRALFNKEVEFYYPKNDILRASAGKWFIERSLKVTDVKVNNVSNTVAVSQFANKRIQGANSSATALVEKVDIYFDRGETIYELKLSGIYKQFENSEQIFAYYTEEGIDKYLTASLFSGVITDVRITNGGSGYTEGTTVPIISSYGSGAQIVISKVTKGIVQAVGVEFGGAGFRVDDSLVIFGSGSGATGNVSNVTSDGFYHPNSYNVVWSTISLETNTPIGNARYSNLVSSITDPANNWIANSMSYFVYGNCGPAFICALTATGTGYVPPITITISANSMISKMGILGRMSVDRPGTGYANGDLIVFTNNPGSTGSGALGYVNVNATGAIVTAKFKPVAGQITGGSGYDALNLPVATVVSGTGTGGNVSVVAVIGRNERLVPSVSDIGRIEQLTIVAGGSNYIDNPTLALNTLGDGLANAELTVVTGAYSYPGRYIDDDGHLSSYNFLEDRDYYQEFSYVVKIDEPINKYRKTLKDLTHPAGTKMFGEFVQTFDQYAETNNNVSIQSVELITNVAAYDTYYQVQGFVNGTFAPNIISGFANVEFVAGSFAVNTVNTLTTYYAVNNNIEVYFNNHGYSANDRVFLQFRANAWANLANVNYVISRSNGNYFSVTNPLTETITGNTGTVRVYNPSVRITLPHSSPSAGQNAYIQFKTVDPSLANGYYQVRSTSAGNTFTVLHPNMTTANDSANVANILTTTVLVRANTHELIAGNSVYMMFIGGDAGNTKNGHYTVTSVKDGNTFNIVVPNIIFTGTTTQTYRGKSTIVIADSSFANGNSVYLTFTSGDQANSVNGVYQPVRVAANTLSVTLARPVTANCGVRAWYSSNNYSNIMFRTGRTTNGFVAGNTLYVEFSTSSIDLANGIYNVKSVYTSNTYNIFYNSNTYTTTVLGNTYNGSKMFTYGRDTSIVRFANVANVVISNTGNGVTNGNITFAGGNGSGIVAYANVYSTALGNVVSVTILNRGSNYYIGDNVTATQTGSVYNATFTVNLQEDANSTITYVANSGLGVVPTSRMEGTALVSLYK